MNNDRRKEIADLRSQMTALMNNIEGVKVAEEEYFDNMPENIQQGERGELSQNAINSMDSAIDNLSNAIADLEDALS